jgi:hypothetical protein
MELLETAGAAVGYRALPWATEAERSYMEMQGAHGSYKDLVKKLK